MRFVADHHRARLVLQRIGVTGQLGADDLFDEPDLGAAVVGIGEAEAQEPVADEPLRRPPVDRGVLARLGGGDELVGLLPARRGRHEEVGRAERAGVGDPKRSPMRAMRHR